FRGIQGARRLRQMGVDRRALCAEAVDHFTSPRRGEVERAQRARVRGVRKFQKKTAASEPPHPDPLPFGEREFAGGSSNAAFDKQEIFYASAGSRAGCGFTGSFSP